MIVFSQLANPEIHLEAAITKICAIEMGHEFNRLLQQVYGTAMTHTSPLDDLLTIADSLLDDSLHNRLMVGLAGMDFVVEQKVVG